MRRLRVALVTGLVLWVALIGRLTMIQLVHGDRLSTCAAVQHVERVTVAAERGPIYDRNMVPLTMDLVVESACAYPSKIENQGTVARGIERAIGGSGAGYARKLRNGKHFAWIKRQLDPDDAARLRSKDLPGIGFIKESKRVYPNGRMACHVLGMTDLDGIGIAGIERAMDEVLSGSEAWVFYRLDRQGHRCPSASCVRVEPKDGMSMVLTLDLELQGIAEVELARAVAEHEAKGGTVIIQDPHTGEILAMANLPDFDPNCPELCPVESQKNRAVTDQFEPGSTFKLITATAALATGAADLTSVYYADRGRRSFGRFWIHDVHEYGWMSLPDAFKKSSNVCFAQIAEAVGDESLFDYATSFGFGCLTGISLPGEVRGILREPWQWSGRSVHSVGIGQEVAVSALQLVGAYSAIANGGNLMEPRIVKAVITDDGRVVALAKPSVVRQVVDPKIASIVQDMLRGVAEEGTGRLAEVPEVSVAGKTGTAQKAEGGHYVSGKHVSSFAGFAPAEHPELVCLVIIDEPKGRGLGGQVAAPAFARIVERIARGPLWRMLETGASGDADDYAESVRRGRSIVYAGTGTTNAIRAQSGAEIVSAELARGPRGGWRRAFRWARSTDTVTPAVLSPGYGSFELDEEGRPVDGSATYDCDARDREIAVPDLRGLSVRAARREAAPLGLILSFEGTGRVRTQSPRPGAVVSYGDRIIVSCYAG